MNRLLRALAPLSIIALAGPSPAAQPGAVAAAAACEDAVAETVREARGREAQDVEFIAGKRALLPATEADETRVRGEGRYRASRGSFVPFTYSCAFNAKTSSTSGVVFKDDSGARMPDRKTWQPDMANFSPEACEAAAAEVLKSKHPRADRISFGSDSRELQPAPDGRTSLQGQGAIVRAPGMNANRFTYRCEFETKSGKVVNLETRD